MEDVRELLNCDSSESLQVKLNLIARSGSVMIREGFRIILKEDHSNNIE